MPRTVIKRPGKDRKVPADNRAIANELEYEAFERGNNLAYGSRAGLGNQGPRIRVIFVPSPSQYGMGNQQCLPGGMGAMGGFGGY